MKRILANDGIADEGKKMLEEAGYEVVTEKIPQDKLGEEINNFDVLIVRSATKVNRNVLENASRLKLVVRAGVGVDNIDIAYAREKGIEVANTPLSSSLSVAELVFAHLFAMTRFLHSSNRELPQDGSRFNELKKSYSDGKELRGKTIGIIGFGRIGQEAAKIAFSLGMNVLFYDHNVQDIKLRFDHLPFKPVPVLELKSSPLNEVLANSDFISLHVPHKEGMPAMIGEESFNRMKEGVGIINCARGGVVDENALIKAIENGKVAYAGLDVFEGEPKVKNEILNNQHISVSPHIGASTIEAQDRIGLEVAQVVMQKCKQN